MSQSNSVSKTHLSIFERAIVMSIVRNDGIKKDQLQKDIYEYSKLQNNHIVKTSFECKQNGPYSEQVHLAFDTLYDNNIISEDDKLLLTLNN